MSTSIKNIALTIFVLLYISCSDKNTISEIKPYIEKNDKGQTMLVGTTGLISSKIGEKRIGLWKRYYPNGKIAWLNLYQNGESKCMLKYNELGNLVSSETYWEDKIDVIHTGAMLVTNSFNNPPTKEIDVEFALVKEYYQNGQLWKKVLFANDIICGDYLEYDQQGKIVCKKSKPIQQPLEVEE